MVKHLPIIHEDRIVIEVESIERCSNNFFLVSLLIIDHGHTDFFRHQEKVNIAEAAAIRLSGVPSPKLFQSVKRLFRNLFPIWCSFCNAKANHCLEDDIVMLDGSCPDVCEECLKKLRRFRQNPTDSAIRDIARFKSSL